MFECCHEPGAASALTFAVPLCAVLLTSSVADAQKVPRAPEAPEVTEGVEETWNQPPAGPVEVAPMAVASRGGGPLPSLEDVIAKAVVLAPDVRSREAAAQVSRTRKVNARRPPLWNPYFEVIAQQPAQGGTAAPWNATVFLPIEVAGNRARRVAEAEAYVSMFEADVDVAAAAAAGAAVAAYGRALVSAERVRVLERLLGVAEQAAEIYEARMEAGDAILRDVAMARMELGRTQALLAEAHGRLAEALADLVVLTGERYDRVETAGMTPPELDLARFLGRVESQELPAVEAAGARGRFQDERKVRLKREAVKPFQLMLIGGQGDFGETRLGAGLAYEIPAFRSLQGERAEAEAESYRADVEGDIRAARIRARVEGIVERYRREREAFEVLTGLALPAADESVEAAVATAAGGKEDAFVVIVSRRERVLLALQRLEVVERQWGLLGELVGLTGELP